jgi:HAD superfamily hydrolase (TIGR01450 family)
MIEIPEVTIEKLITDYSVILLDAYGVLVDMRGALPGAVGLVERLNRMKKPYFILTNDASKLPETSARHYQDFGLNIAPQRIITSGALLKDYFKTNHLISACCIVLGPKDSVRYVEDAGGKVVSPSESFDAFVLADEAGFPFLETLDAVLTALFQKLDREENVHLILPNPDLIYPKANRGFGIASGCVALMIEAALQLRYQNHEKLSFERLGKPHAAIFEQALQRSATLDMVMIGDQIETDIRGARAFGIDSVLIDTGVTQINVRNIPEYLHPTYLLKTLC